MPGIEINVEALDAVIAAKLPEFHAAIASPPNAQEEALGLFSMDSITGAIDKAEGARATFCEVWPKARKFILLAVGIFGMFNKGGAAAGAVVEGLDKEFYPKICPK